MGYILVTKLDILFAKQHIFYLFSILAHAAVLFLVNCIGIDYIDKILFWYFYIFPHNCLISS